MNRRRIRQTYRKKDAWTRQRNTAAEKQVNFSRELRLQNAMLAPSIRPNHKEFTLISPLPKKLPSQA